MSSRRAFPPGTAYAEALQNTARCFKDHDLRGGAVAKNRIGLPKAISGNFASVFCVTSSSGHSFAVKCFTRDVPDQHERYRAISDALTALTVSWTVGFRFLDDGVLVAGAWYPVLRMDWIDAMGLIPWIERHLQDPMALADLADQFVDVVLTLEGAGYAHGDLQHGNLLVTPTGRLTLIDYDGMYVPALASLGASEHGHRNYQPPTRGSMVFGPKLDRFSAWVIYLSLRALAVEPGLWSRLHPTGAEQLLMSADDYTDLDASHRVRLICDADPSLRSVAGPFLDAARGAGGLPPLPPVGSRSARPALGRLGAAPAVASGGRPGWLPLPDSMTPPSAPSTLPGDPGRPGLAARLIARGGLLSSIACVVCLFLPSVAVPAAGWLGMLVPLIAASEWWLFHRSAVSRGRRAAKRELRRARRAYHRAARVLRTARAEHEELELRYVYAVNRRAAKRRRLDDELTRRLAIADDEMNKRLQDLARRRAAFDHQQAVALEAELRRMRDQHVDTYLASQQIANARIAGIGTGLVEALGHAGIRTAYDFTGLVYRQGSPQYGTAMAFVALRGGPAVRVPGIGEVKARRLEAWRATLLVNATRTAPQQLPTSFGAAISSAYASKVAALDAEQQHIRAHAVRQRDQAAAEVSAERVALAGEERSAGIALERDRALRAMAVTNAEAGTATTSAVLAPVERQWAALRGLTYRRYVRRAVIR